MNTKRGYVYIIVSKKFGTLYIGVTSNLSRRIHEHLHGTVNGFSEENNCIRLVYYEIYELIQQAIEREKQLKNWRRQWKINLFQQTNPDWNDLSNEVLS